MMQQDIEDATSRCTFLERSLATLQSESEALLTQDAAPAMDALLVLVNRIESLHDTTQNQKTSSSLTIRRDPRSALGMIQVRAPLVNACKSQSRVVFAHFKSLSEKARNLTQMFTEVCRSAQLHVTITDVWVRYLALWMHPARDGLYV